MTKALAVVGAAILAVAAAPAAQADASSGTLFVRFGEVFEGFLPARRLPGDYFELNELATALVGRRGGGTYRLGDPIAVLVERIEKTEGKVELSQAARTAK